MVTPIKSKEEILKKLGIAELNEMQKESHSIIKLNDSVVLLSPTGTGKTLAFLLPILEMLDPKSDQIQALILVPSRELALQIEQVIREIGSGFKANAVYGGRSGSKDRMDLKHNPAILVGTPGRVADHFRRETFEVKNIKILVLDEFDKSLEIGFEAEMTAIIEALPNLKNRILTSATQKLHIPNFVGIVKHRKLDYLDSKTNKLSIKTISSDKLSKLETLEQLISQLGNTNGIIFCNQKESINRVSSFFHKKNISHATFHGDLEQVDRERALIKFRNGTHRLLIATDLAARGIDVPQLDFIIHYEIPPKEDEFIHRNGRTARMHNNGTAYIIKQKDAPLPEFIKEVQAAQIETYKPIKNNNWATLYILGGRKDKISKGDIAGLFFKVGKLQKDELGIIELKQDCAYVAVIKTKADELVNQLTNTKLKKKKIRVSLLA